MNKLDYNRVEIVLVEWLQDKVKKAGARGVVVGLSGGIDSAVVSALSKKAFGSEVLGIIMPCHSKESDASDAIKVAGVFDIDYIIQDLSPAFDELLNIFQGNSDQEKNKMAIANIKPRLRMTTLYYYAAINNYLVVGTDNWSELKVGYFTKHGDGGIDLAPLGRLVKTEVRELALHLGVPESIIKKPPSAGLWQDQTDEEELGLSYEVLDRYILTGEANPEDQARIDELAALNEHKLQPVPIPDRDTFAFD